MIKSQTERHLESITQDRCATDKPFEFERVKLPGVNLDTVMQFEWKMREYNEDALVYEMLRQNEIIGTALLRTACEKYMTITGKHAVDLTHGVPEDFRAVYNSALKEMVDEMWLALSENEWPWMVRMLARFILA